MRLHRILPTLAAALLGAGACRSGTPIVAPSQSGVGAALVGSWTLTSACGGIAYICHPISTLQVPDHIVFQADGTMDYFRAGSPNSTQGTWVVTPSPTDPLRSGTLKLTPGLEDVTDTVSIAFSIEGELVLSQPCCDRLAYTFRSQFGPD